MRVSHTEGRKRAKYVLPPRVPQNAAVRRYRKTITDSRPITSIGRAFGRPMEIRRGGLAGVAVRRPGHASLYADCHAVCRTIAARGAGRQERWLLQLVDSGGVFVWLGDWRRIVWTAGRPAGTQPDAGADNSDL